MHIIFFTGDIMQRYASANLLDLYQINLILVFRQIKEYSIKIVNKENHILLDRILNINSY